MKTDTARICSWIQFVCSMHSGPWDTKVCREKGFIQQAAKRGGGRTILTSTLGHLWDKETGWSEAWGMWEKGDWREEKGEGIVVLHRCNQAVNTCLFMGHVFRKRLCQPVLKVEFGVFWYQKVTNGTLNTCPFGGLNHYSAGARTSEQLTPNSWKTTWANISLFKLHHAWRTYKLL